MGFMDKVLYNAKNVANAASEKAGEVYEVGKLKLRLAGLNGDLAFPLLMHHLIYGLCFFLACLLNIV